MSICGIAIGASSVLIAITAVVVLPKICKSFRTWHDRCINDISPLYEQHKKGLK